MKMQDRKYWLDTMLKIVDPILRALANGELKKVLPIEGEKPREYYMSCTYLEAFGRTLAGIAPWLGCTSLEGEEEEKRIKMLALVHKCLDNATDPESDDFMNFSNGHQPLVDAAFLAQGILRAPHVLWEPLEERVKKNIIACMRSTRVITPPQNNWLLFSAMVECLIRYSGAEDWDAMRIDYALRKHFEWYKGDGVYGDGEFFHWDYYNSFVIQPMLVETLEQIKNDERFWQWSPRLHEGKTEEAWLRLTRYATVLESLIAPDGSYPLIGRSLCYRFGAFHALAMAAWREKLGDTLSAPSVRCALTAVIKRTMAFDSNFDENGFLRHGVCGHQPALAENYISTGSLYLCSFVFLPLGLPATHPFWSEPDSDWTMKRLWNGENRAVEHAIP